MGYGTCTSAVRAAARFWRTFVVVLTPLLALPVPLIARTQEAYCGYCIIIMAVYWMTEAIPIQVTALLPVVLFPLAGVLATKEVCGQYMTAANMLFLGGLMVAAAVEHSGLHLRIALRVLILMGSDIKWLMMGFMMVTMFLSMWISNTATTAMMTPIIGQIIDILMESEWEDGDPPDGAEVKADSPERPAADGAGPDEARPGLENDHPRPTALRLEEGRSPLGLKREQLAAALYISVAYSANCGGTGTLTGTNPNLVLMGQLQELFGNDTGLTYATFMMFGVPAMLICTLLAWLWIVTVFLGIRQFRTASREEKARFVPVRRALRSRYSELGPMTFHEKMVTLLFTVLVVLWFLREPVFMPGWMDLVTGWMGRKDFRITDATPAIIIVTLMFMIPAKPNFAFWSERKRSDVAVSEGLLTWKAVHEKVSWGVLILLGGGFAMARATKVSGLAVWMGGQLSFALALPPALLVFIICLLTAMLTEVSSNTATATILLPVLAAVSQRAGVNPLYLMLPVTLTCSYAFMLPVATPPNAIVHQAGQLRTADMIRAGIVMNVLCVAVITGLTNTLGVAVFDLHTFPAWANTTALPAT